MKKVTAPQVATTTEETKKDLPESVQAFPDGPDFLRIFESAGFINTTWTPLTFGVASIYVGHKPA